MNELWHELRMASRAIRRRPRFSIIVVLTLALGIGANTAIFSVVDAVLLKPLAFREAERLVLVNGSDGGAQVAPAPADYLDIRSRARSFTGMAAYRRWRFNLREGDRTDPVEGASVTSDFFPLLGAAPQLGRVLIPDGSGRLPIAEVVISDHLWRSRLGGSPNVLGRAIIVDGRPFTVVGVMRPGFTLPVGAEFWLPSPFAVPPHPLDPGTDPSLRRDTHYFDVVARLAGSVSLAQARVEVTGILKEIQQRDSSSEPGVVADLVPIRADLAGDSTPALLVLLGSATVLLLIACANLANLFLADASARQREWTVRAALGASRRRLASGRLAESLLLSAIGGISGLVVAVWGVSALRALAPDQLAVLIAFSPDVRVLGFTATVSLLAGIAFGVGPALRIGRSDTAAALREESRGTADSPRRRRVRQVLVVSEVALAFVLTIAAGLLIKAFIRVQRVPVGVEAEGVLTAGVVLPPAKYGEPGRRAQFVRDILERIQATPGVTAASVVSRLPLDPGGSTRSMEVQGRAQRGEDVSPDYLVIAPDYLRSMGIPLLKGREFTSRDERTAPPVAIVSEATAKAFWPGEDPIGKGIRIGDDSATWREVVGVAADVRQHRLDAPPRPAVYLPYPQDPWSFFTVVVRTRTSPAAVRVLIAREIQAVDRDLGLSELRTMDAVVGDSLAARRFSLVLIGVFAASALLLGTLGIYGVISYTVTQRTREVGIRLAVGAQPGDVVRLVVGSGLRLALVGTLIGLVGALALTPVLRSLLFGITATDPETFVQVAALMGGVALLASYLPARRAASTDPMTALRAE